MSDLRDQGRGINAFSDFALIQCGIDSCKSMDARQQGSLGTILELDYKHLILNLFTIDCSGIFIPFSLC